MPVLEPVEAFAPIFIVGVQRSGTTLLRTMLHAHSDLCIGYECALYKILGDRYEGGVAAQDAETFLDDLLAVRRFDLWDLDRDTLRTAIFDAEAGGSGPIAYVEVLYRIALCYLQKEKPEATHFGFKNPHGIYHLEFIFDLFPKARILHMIRDPRGVLSSEKKKRSKIDGYKPEETTWMVARRHRKMMQIAEAYKSDPRYLAIQYRDLVTNFEPTLGKVLTFLDLEFEDEVRTYHLTARDGGFTPEKELWQHSKSLEPPDPSRVDKFQTELTLRERSTMEMVCGRTLTKLPGASRSGSFLEGAIGVSQILLSKLAQQAGSKKQTDTPENESLDSKKLN